MAPIASLNLEGFTIYTRTTPEFFEWVAKSQFAVQGSSLRKSIALKQSFQNRSITFCSLAWKHATLQAIKKIEN